LLTTRSPAGSGPSVPASTGVIRTRTAVSGGWGGTDPLSRPTMAWASSVAAFDAGAPSASRTSSRSAALGATLSPARSGGGLTQA